MGQGMTNGRIAITGATGFIGQRLVAMLAAAPEPVEITVLTRDPVAARRLYPETRFPGLALRGYDPEDARGIAAALDGASAVIHLAGAPIATRWTPEARAAIRTSRIAGTRALVDAIASMPERPGLLISSSACRYYGTSETARFDETSPPGPAGDFLGDICRGWEAEAGAAADLGLRVVILRTGIVLGLTAEGRRMIERMRRFLGGRIGSGRQWVSWIHRDDVARIVLRALAEPGMAGVYNATAPTPARMLQVTDAFARVMGSFLRVPIPGAILGEVLGDAATVILEGQRVHPDRLLAEGFAFRFPAIGPAVHDILTNPDAPPDGG
jgi:uncharacterized protein (TIGR01777 family)